MLISKRLVHHLTSRKFTQKKSVLVYVLKKLSLEVKMMKHIRVKIIVIIVKSLKCGNIVSVPQKYLKQDITRGLMRTLHFLDRTYLITHPEKFHVPEKDAL